MSQPPGPFGPPGQSGQQGFQGPPPGPPNSGFPAAGGPAHPGQPGGGFPPPPPGQQPPGQFGGPMPGQQPPPYPGGYPPPPPQGKGKSKLPWILGGVGAVVLIGIAVTLVLVLSAGSTPRDVADQAVQAIETRNSEISKSLACQPGKDVLTAKDLKKNLKARVDNDGVETGDKAKVPVTINAPDVGQPIEINLELGKNADEDWCIEKIGNR